MTSFLLEETISHYPEQHNPLSWVVIDANVDDFQKVVQGIKSGHQIFILDSSKDGVEQITQLFRTAQQQPEILHLVSHGSPGTLYLGNSQLSLNTLAQYEQALAQWSAAQLLIYGCNVAAGDAGAEFVQKMQELTQANIAASTQKVGVDTAGSSWNLETTLGAVLDSDVFTSTFKTSYTSTFAAKLYSQFTDNSNNAGQFNTPDGDFGPNIRVGNDGARDVTGVPPNQIENPATGTPLPGIQPIEFYITTDVVASPVESAFLYLSIFDVDAPREVNEVFFNNEGIGILEGEDDLTFRSVFELDPATIITGNNFIRINIDVNNQGLEAAIERADLLINYTIGNSIGNAFIDTKSVDRPFYDPGNPVVFTADIDTTLTTQNVDVETILRDPNGVAVDFDSRPESANKLLTGDSDADAFTWTVNLPDDAVDGLWRIEITVFDVATGNFQVLDGLSFPVGCGEPGPPSVFQFKQYVQFEEVVEGRSYLGPSAQFEERLYLTLNPDVKAAVDSGLIPSGEFHYLNNGRAEGRQLLPLDLEIGGLKIASLFDETYYLDQNPDVLTASLTPAFVYGFDHFVKFGLYEGRNPSYYYDEATYLAANPDVAAAVGTIFASGLEHYLKVGHIENRDPSTLFDANDYLAAYADVRDAIADGRFQSAFDHYIEFGAAEGRINTLLYEEAFYLATNPEVQAAVDAGDFQSGYAHYIQNGQREGRDPSPLFDESAYLGCNPDVDTVVPGDLFASGMEHYFRAGRQEGRPSFLVPEAMAPA